MHEKFVPIEHAEGTLVSDFSKGIIDPNQVNPGVRGGRRRELQAPAVPTFALSPFPSLLQLRWFPQPLLAKPGTVAPAAAVDASAAAAGGAGGGVDAPAAGGAGAAGEPAPEIDWVDGLATMAGNGDPTAKSGMAVHVYNCNKSMVDTAMYNSDGDFLIVPQEGTLHIQTEMGFLEVAPKEIVVIQRGIRFRVAVDGPSRGYVCEIYGGHFQLPDLGPIGANGLANARDFLYPVAAYEDRDVDYVVVNKFGGRLFSTIMHHSPFNVVAWHGNYAPYKYDLSKFNTMNSVSYDHPDPSIYTVLTCPTDTPGVALCDFVIFPPRWMVMDKSFRPPYYHRNTMTEFMGMVWGKYDAKVGFQPGGASLHSCMSAHGPDADTFLKASNAELKPEYFGAGLAFMFETTLQLKLTPWALAAPHRDAEYRKCWQQLPRVFDPHRRDVSSLVIKLKPDADGALSHGSDVGRLLGDGTTSAAVHIAKRAALEGGGSGGGGASRYDASVSATADGGEEGDGTAAHEASNGSGGAAVGSKRKRA